MIEQVFTITRNEMSLAYANVAYEVKAKTLNEAVTLLKNDKEDNSVQLKNYSFSEWFESDSAWVDGIEYWKYKNKEIGEIID